NTCKHCIILCTDFVSGHPNTRVFITHGGLMGTQEAIYTGVPMVGIPLFSDQRLNIENYVTKGIAVKLEYDDITKDNVLEALKTILDNPSYKENAERISRIFKDRPQSALDTAIFWTEYVIRHKGAPHLRSAAVDLSWYQYLLIDVIFFLLLVTVCVLFIIYFIARKIALLFFAKRPLPSANGIMKKQKSE
ncbi:hypothetical protein ANN_23394, partial [Periplaneta americana]